MVRAIGDITNPETRSHGLAGQVCCCSPEGMEMKFEHVELLQTASLNPHTMRLLPRGKQKVQKIVVGDIEGVLACYSVRKGEAMVCNVEIEKMTVTEPI